MTSKSHLHVSWGVFFPSSPCVFHSSQPRALQRVLLSPKAHQQELLYFHNRIVHVKTSRDRAGGDLCTCQDE